MINIVVPEEDMVEDNVMAMFDECYDDDDNTYISIPDIMQALAESGLKQRQVDEVRHYLAFKKRIFVKNWGGCHER